MFVLSTGGALIVYFDSQGVEIDSLLPGIYGLFILVFLLLLVYMFLVLFRGHPGNESELAIAQSVHRSAVQDEEERQHHKRRLERQKQARGNK